MNSFFTRDKIDQLIKEDVPYFDLTTHVLGIGTRKGILTYTTREKTVVACVEEAAKVMEALDIEVIRYVPSGTRLMPDEVIIEGKGNADALQKAWKVIVNILEYSCGIATRTHNVLSDARKINPDIHLLSTRKVFPGTKELAVKAVMCGGGYPHRLGISESILIFDQHLNFFDTKEEIDQAIIQAKKDSLEKKVILEVASEADAMHYMTLPIDGMQFDKFPCDLLTSVVNKIRSQRPDLFLIAAGGVNANNAADYASTGVDALVTTAMYFGKPSDIKARLKPIT